MLPPGARTTTAVCIIEVLRHFSLYDAFKRAREASEVRRASPRQTRTAEPTPHGERVDGSNRTCWSARLRRRFELNLLFPLVWVLSLTQYYSTIVQVHGWFGYFSVPVALSKLQIADHVSRCFRVECAGMLACWNAGMPYFCGTITAHSEFLPWL